ncbi:hypothetical protein CapIbe_014834 [Capra ibex]
MPHRVQAAEPPPSGEQPPRLPRGCRLCLVPVSQAHRDTHSVAWPATPTLRGGCSLGLGVLAAYTSPRLSCPLGLCRPPWETGWGQGPESRLSQHARPCPVPTGGAPAADPEQVGPVTPPPRDVAPGGQCASVLQWLNLQRCQQVAEVGGAGPGAWPAPQGPVDEVAGMAVSGVAAGL